MLRLHICYGYIALCVCEKWRFSGNCIKFKKKTSLNLLVIVRINIDTWQLLCYNMFRNKFVINVDKMVFHYWEKGRTNRMGRKPLKIVTCCLAGALLTAVPVYDVEAAPSAGVSKFVSSVVESELNTSSPVAGVSLVVTSYLEENMASQQSSVAALDSEKVGASNTDNSKTKKKKETKQAKASKYSNMAVAQVNDYVNIRKKPNEDSKLLGKLYSNSVATVLKKKGGWYKIKSGSVTGYVKGDYVVVGDEDLVKSVGVQIATVNTTTLKVRGKASKKAEVLTLVPGGEELTVASMKAYDDGWVKVAVDGGQGYVSSDYVDISRQYNYAESRAEEEARLAIEQARIAAEEEARRAQEEANAASVTGGSTSGGTGTSSSSSSSSSSTQNTGGASSSSGQSVVNYASQFLGNPYVYGGSSLTNGADCSGFVMSVYAHFGVSLPHSSGALRGVGYGVSYDSMQPGDIVCYDGHVAIYAGGNTVIHASSPATGIKYTSPANYRSVVAVRRIF